MEKALVDWCERIIANLKEDLKSIGSLNKRWIIERDIDMYKAVIEKVKEEGSKCACKKAAPVSLNAREEFFKEEM